MLLEITPRVLQSAAVNPKHALLANPNPVWAAAVRDAASLWAEATSRPESVGRDDLLRVKRQLIEAFFAFAGKRPGDVSPQDVAAWRAELEARGLSANTVYKQLSLLSSFYTWAARHADDAESVHANPVRLARPHRPRPYQSESTKALSNEKARALLAVIRARACAEQPNLVAKRDLALALWYVLTGMRRAEVMSLRGRDVEVKADHLLVRGRVKGGTYVGREIKEPELRQALLDYLKAAKRLSVLGTDGPLWTRHDKGGQPGLALSSHAFALNLKRYAREAGIDRIHLHQTRHTYARMVSEETGSLLETQDALGHASPSTTRVYVQRIAIKRDKHSRSIAEKLR